MYPISLHRVVADGALDRRSIEEQFLFWAKQYNELGDYNIALRTLIRAQLKLDAFQEIWSNRTSVFTTIPHPFDKSAKFNKSGLDIDAAPGGDFWIDWSINIQINYTFSPPGDPVLDSQILILVPFVDGKLLWAAADKIELEWPWDTAVGGRDTSLPNETRDGATVGSHSLSGRGHFSTSTGGFEVGLIAASISAASTFYWSRYDGKAANIVVRRAH